MEPKPMSKKILKDRCDRLAEMLYNITINPRNESKYSDMDVVHFCMALMLSSKLTMEIIKKRGIENQLEEGMKEHIEVVKFTKTKGH